MAKKTKPKKAPKASARKPAKKVAKAAKAAKPQSSGKQTFLDHFAREHTTTLKLLRALPPDQTELRPHARAKSARELANVFVLEQMLITKALTGELAGIFRGGGPPPAPADFNAIVSQFEREFESTLDLVKKATDSKLSSTVQFPTGPGQMGDWGILSFLWFVLHDQIHHRGQFSVYVRMANGKVPSIYGPSADEPWR